MEPEQKITTGYLDEFAGQGFETLGAGDYAIPFLKILQTNSPECAEGDPAYVPGAKAGVFFNTLTKRIYGMEIEVIPLHYESVWLAWAPNRGGLRGRFEPGSISVEGEPFSGMTSKVGDEICDIVENMVFYCMIVGHFEEGPVVFPLSSTGLRHAKNWNSQILLTRLESGKRAPYFSSVWKLTLSLNQNDQGRWYQIGVKTTNVERVRFVTKEELLNIILDNRKMVTSGERRIDFAQIEAPSGQSRDAGNAKDY